MNKNNGENDSLNVRNLIQGFSRILLCSHDQGGAEVLSSWAANENRNFDFILGDDALRIFREKIPNLEKLVSLNRINHDLVISTLGWQTNFEYEVLARAIKGGARALIFLDHYGDYFDCLTRDGITQKVDWIVAFDEISRKKAIEQLPNSTIFFIPNLYVQSTAMKAKALKEKSSERYQILYLSEPHQPGSAYNEIDAIRYFFRTLSDNQLTKIKILIRTHPSENTGKYASEVPIEFENVKFSRGNPLELDVASSCYAVGAYTTALKVAALSGNSTFSTLLTPPLTQTVPYRHLLELVNELTLQIAD